MSGRGEVYNVHRYTSPPAIHIIHLYDSHDTYFCMPFGAYTRICGALWQAQYTWHTTHDHHTRDLSVSADVVASTTPLPGRFWLKYVWRWRPPRGAVRGNSGRESHGGCCRLVCQRERWWGPLGSSCTSDIGWIWWILRPVQVFVSPNVQERRPFMIVCHADVPYASATPVPRSRPTCHLWPRQGKRPWHVEPVHELSITLSQARSWGDLSY